MPILLGRRTPVTTTLLAVIAVVFLAELATGSLLIQLGGDQIPQELRELRRCGKRGSLRKHCDLALDFLPIFRGIGRVHAG